jgi:hydroxymethylglutaryl-CoA synthase
MTSIVSYATYLPRHHVLLGKASRVVAGFDEDSTTMAVEAARRAATDGVSAVYFATTSPAYADKTNASSVHAALGLPPKCFAVDLGASARGGVGALRAAAASGGLAALADVRMGRPESADERSGGDGAAAFVFGDEGMADVLGQASVTAEVLDRWRAPGDYAARVWEERFGLDAYLPLVAQAGEWVLADCGVANPDHLVVASPNRPLLKKAAGLFGASATTTSPIGHAGAADVGLALAEVLDRAEPGQTVLVISAEGGADALLLRTTDQLTAQTESVATQRDSGHDVDYVTYLQWRGLLDREPPRRPEPDVPAAPPSARAAAWKFGFRGSACAACGFMHLPPVRVCKRCGSSEPMTPHPVSRTTGTVATFTVDRLAFSPSPPVINAVVDFDGGGRFLLELTDTDPDDVTVGARVEPTFRRLYTANGVHNYFWKGRVIR